MPSALDVLLGECPQRWTRGWGSALGKIASRGSYRCCAPNPLRTETRHRFAYHGTSGYSASFILATGMICPSESKPGEVFKGAAGCGVGGYGRGVYTTFSFTQADKHAPATVLGIEESLSGEPRADNDKATKFVLGG